MIIRGLSCGKAFLCRLIVSTSQVDIVSTCEVDTGNMLSEGEQKNPHSCRVNLNYLDPVYTRWVPAYIRLSAYKALAPFLNFNGSRYFNQITSTAGIHYLLLNKYIT